MQVVEFVEGEPTKFLLVAGDQRLHLKASSIDEKQQWVKYLRSSILCLNPLATPIKPDRSKMLEPEAILHDLKPSPTASPIYHKRKEFLGNGDISISPVHSTVATAAAVSSAVLSTTAHGSLNTVTTPTQAPREESAKFGEFVKVRWVGYGGGAVAVDLSQCTEF